MDGDSSAKTMDKGATAAKPFTDFGDDTIHEASKPRGEPLGEKTTGAGTSAFDAQGAIGKQFTTGGVLGGTAQKIGGPFDKDGAIGKQFTTGGSIGASVQEHLGQGENSTFQK
ncbi:hypothetical protein CAC42_8142 [Sphaceloma murrayae]|uniref:Uncharacterized protein n=1 Tax=Sphaceloma murrayae TaxID=2082308 RepID=A0A2K1QJL2_9PEZI|nr:hypothetical protein CAC42_8142 [Sphaceloma murrayae]